MYGCILIPPEMSLVFALEPQKRPNPSTTPPSSSLSSSSPPSSLKTGASGNSHNILNTKQEYPDHAPSVLGGHPQKDPSNAPPHPHPHQDIPNAPSGKPHHQDRPSAQLGGHTQKELPNAPQGQPQQQQQQDHPHITTDDNKDDRDVTTHTTATTTTTSPEIRSSLLANAELTPGTVFYPDDGDMRLERIADPTILAQDDIRRAFGGYDVMIRVDGQEVRHCNWVRFVKSSDDSEAANIICSTGRGQTQYYQVVRPIRTNHELVVYFKMTPERTQPRSHNLQQSTVVPTNFQSFDHSMFYPRTLYPFSQQQQQQQVHEKKHHQPITNNNIISSGGGTSRRINSPIPAMLLRHYDKIMTSTPINMKNDAKNASSSLSRQRDEDKAGPRGVILRQSTAYNQGDTQQQQQHYHHHHLQLPYYQLLQQHKNQPTESSSILSNISLSSSFSSSPMTKSFPHSPPPQTDGLDYSITKNTRNEINSSFSPATMTSSNLSRDSERVSSDSAHSLKIETDESSAGQIDVEVTEDDVRNENDGDDEVEEDDSNARDNKSDNSEDVENIIDINKESEEEFENVSFVHESRGVKDDNTTTDDTEDDAKVDVDSTSVDLAIHCDEDDDNGDDDDDVFKPDSVKNIRSKSEEGNAFVVRGNNKLKGCTSSNSRLVNIDSVSLDNVENNKRTNSVNSNNTGLRHDRTCPKDGRRVEGFTSEQQITSSTSHFYPALKSETSQRFDQSDSLEMSRGSNSSQSQPLDCSREKVTRCSPSNNDNIMFNIKPEMMVSTLPSSVNTLMTSRDAKPMKRCRERSWWPCEVCGKKFDRPSLLKRHIRTHTGEKPHACDVCGKAFSTSSSLNTHRRIHSGEKPHQCKVCGKRFTASSNLYYHRMTHNKEKPHKCTLCSKSFPTPGDLRSHQYIHSGSWPFRCHVCNRGFSKQTNLRNHMMLHSGDKPHECSRCGKKFALLCNLKTHFKTHDSSDSSDVTDGSKCDDSTEDTSGHHVRQDNNYTRNSSSYLNSFVVDNDVDNPAHNNRNANNYPTTKNTTKVVSTTNPSKQHPPPTSLKRKHSQSDLPRDTFTTYRYTEPPKSNPQKVRRHTDFSISKLTSSDDNVSKYSNADDSDVIKRSLPKDIDNHISDPHEIFNSLSVSNPTSSYPLMYKHLIAAAAAASQQQQQLQQQQQQQQHHHLLHSTPDLQHLHQQHQEWLLSQHACNKINPYPFQPVPFHPAALTTPNAFHKSNLFPFPPQLPPPSSSSSASSPLSFKNVAEDSNAPPSSTTKLIGSGNLAYATTAAPSMTPVPVFFKPEMMSYPGGGAFMSRIPTIPTIPAFWGGHMTTNGF